VAIICSGFKGAFAIDDAYCGRPHRDCARRRPVGCRDRGRGIASAWPDPLEGLNAPTYGPPGLEADIEFCAQVDLLDVAPVLSRMIGKAAEIRREL